MTRGLAAGRDIRVRARDHLLKVKGALNFSGMADAGGVSDPYRWRLAFGCYIMLKHGIEEERSHGIEGWRSGAGF
jgi:hypothetical protein